MYKRKMFPIVLLCAVMFFAGAGAGFFTARYIQSSAPPRSSAPPPVREAQAQSSAKETQKPDTAYLIKLKDGTVGVFKLDGSGNPVFEYYADEINVKTLREEDKKRLEDGITAHGHDELAAILEDFSS